MTEQLNRRKFLRGSAVAGAAALATPAIAENHGETLKMQAAWGGGIFLENAQSFATRVNEMSGGSLTIEVLSVDAVVKTSQMQDAVHRGVLDAAHYVPAYWYGKSKAASLFGTGPCFGWSSQEVLGWVYAGGGQELFDELVKRFRKEVVAGTAKEFIAAKLAERDERHRRSGNSRYLVEPNVKDGKGGLRDLNTLFWLGKYVYQVDHPFDSELASIRQKILNDLP